VKTLRKSNRLVLVRNNKVYAIARAQICASNSVRIFHAKDLNQHSVSLSLLLKVFSVDVNYGGKLHWAGFASSYRNQQNKLYLFLATVGFSGIVSLSTFA